MGNSYELIIRNASQGGEKQTNNQNAASSAPDTAEEVFGKMRKVGNIATKALSSATLAKNVIGYELSQVGVRAGNQHLQDKINYGTQIAEQAISVGISFLINPVMGAAALVGIGVSMAQKADQYYQNLKWENLQIAQNRQRAGTTWDGSRKEGR